MSSDEPTPVTFKLWNDDLLHDLKAEVADETCDPSCKAPMNKLSNQVLRVYQKTAYHDLVAWDNIFSGLSPRTPYMPPERWSKRWWRKKTYPIRKRWSRLAAWRIINLNDGWTDHRW